MTLLITIIIIITIIILLIEKIIIMNKGIIQPIIIMIIHSKIIEIIIETSREITKTKHLLYMYSKNLNPLFVL